MPGRPRAIFPAQDGRQERVKINAPAPIEGRQWAVKSTRWTCGYLLCAGCDSQLKSRNMLDLVVHSGLVVHLGELLGH